MIDKLKENGLYDDSHPYFVADSPFYLSTSEEIFQEVPQKIADHFPNIIHPFLEKNGLNIKDIDHLIFHPGGKKIVQTVEDLFGDLGKNINDTKEVLRLYGNMSSATVLYVLERFMDRDLPKGDKGLMLSFGPGFSAQRILLEW